MANGEDYNNIFSGDYWTPEGYKKRKAGQREAHSKLAQEQSRNRVNEWDNIGKALGGINKPIGDFFNGLPANQRKVRNQRAIANRKPAPGAGVEAYASKTKPGPSLVSDKIKSKGPRDGRNTLPPGWRDRMEPVMDPQQSFFDELLGKVTSDWSGPDKSKIDYSPLDAALNSRLGALNNLRSTTQGNYDKSDVALEGMHRAQQDRMGTEGVARYNQIADTAKANLSSDAQIAQDNIQKIKAEDLAKRQAMLQNLGLPANELDVAPDEILGQAQASIASRTDANVTSQEANRGTNLAFNQGMINSVGQAGVERRAELGQQLQAILGRIGMAEADAQAENANARFQLEQSAGDKQYQQWMGNKEFYRDTVRGMEQDAQKAREAAMENEDPREIGGFAGINQDLVNSGYDIPEIQNAMGVLADITASDYRKGIDPNAGYNQADILQRRLVENGVDKYLAFQIATNYSNMGNTSKYEDLPY